MNFPVFCWNLTFFRPSLPELPPLQDSENSCVIKIFSRTRNRNATSFAVQRHFDYIDYIQMKVPVSMNCIGGVMISMPASSAVNRGFEPRSGHTKDYEIGICCFSAKHAALRRKNKDWLVRNQNNVSKWSDMSSRKLLFQ